MFWFSVPKPVTVTKMAVLDLSVRHTADSATVDREWVDTVVTTVYPAITLCHRRDVGVSTHNLRELLLLVPTEVWLLERQGLLYSAHCPVLTVLHNPLGSIEQIVTDIDKNLMSKISQVARILSSHTLSCVSKRLSSLEY